MTGLGNDPDGYPWYYADADKRLANVLFYAPYTGTYYIAVQAWNLSKVKYGRYHLVFKKDNQATGAVVLNAPVGGEVWQEGEKRQVSWTAAGFPINDAVNLLYSIDSGATWKCEKSFKTFENKYDFVVPPLDSSNSKILFKMSDCILGSPVAAATAQPLTFQMLNPDIYEPNDVKIQATPVTAGDSLTKCNLAVRNAYRIPDIDFYTFTADAGDQMIVRSQAWDNKLPVPLTDLIRAFYDSTGTKTLTPSSTTANDLRVYAPYTGRYYLKFTCGIMPYDLRNLPYYKWYTFSFRIQKDTIVPPEITITSPIGGEVWDDMMFHQVTWQCKGIQNDLYLFYSLDNGRNWTNYGRFNKDSLQAIFFVLPVDSVLKTVRFKLVGKSLLGDSVVDTTDNPMSFRTVLPDIQEPNNYASQAFELHYGDTLVRGTFPQRPAGSPPDKDWFLINATTGDSIRIATYNILPYGSSRACLKIMDSSSVTVLKVEASPFSMEVRFTAPYTGKLYAEYLSDFGQDVTGAYSMVLEKMNEKKSFTLICPNGGEYFSDLDTNLITWKTEGYLPRVTIEFTIDDTIRDTITRYAIPNTGSYKWYQPGNISRKCKVQIYARERNAFGESAGYFIRGERPEIVIKSPTANFIYTPGCTATFYWNSRGFFDSFEVDFSADSGIQWAPIASGIPDTGSYKLCRWQIPLTCKSRNCKIRVRGMIPNFSALSPSFKILPTLTVLRPNGGETLLNNTVNTIRWTSVGMINRVNIEVTTDHGLNWHSIAGAIDNTDTLDWLVTEKVSKLCWIRITDQEYQEITDRCNSSFTIRDITGIITTQTAGGLRFTACPNPAGNKSRNKITFKLSYKNKPIKVSVKIFDHLLNEVSSLQLKPAQDAFYADWNLTNKSGAHVASATYCAFCKIVTSSGETRYLRCMVGIKKE